MVTLSDDPNTWGEQQLHECNLDEETDTMTCVSVCDYISQHVVIATHKTIHSNMLLLIFTYFEYLGRGR